MFGGMSMSKIFVTSDLHFWHTNIIKFENRPWKTVEEMNQGLYEKKLETNWKELKEWLEEQKKIGQAQDKLFVVNITNTMLSKMQEIESNKVGE